MVIAFFAASRYWQDLQELNEVYQSVQKSMGVDADSCFLIVDGDGVEGLPVQKGEALVIVPMSGAVQKYILQAAGMFEAAVIYAAYVQGNASEKAAQRMLEYNAAPTVMDSWSVLRKQHRYAQLALDAPSLANQLLILGAYKKIRHAKLLLIGEPEPWVISVSRSLEDYEKLGITIQQIDQQEVKDMYAQTTEDEGRPYAEKFQNGAQGCKEPTPQDIQNAGRMAASFLKILDKYQADGMAVACFNLLSLGTTSCLGVSYINDCTDKIAACEGDLDSAITMLMLKQLTKTKLWMANPGIHPGGVVNFSHCTAPLAIDSAEDWPYILRSHHESGIGVSLQVDLSKAKRRVTACRISGKWKTFTAQCGNAEMGPHERCCHTQLYVTFDHFDHYLKTVLGCHQVLAFEEIQDEFASLAQCMGLAPETES